MYVLMYALYLRMPLMSACDQAAEFGECGSLQRTYGECAALQLYREYGFSTAERTGSEGL